MRKKLANIESALERGFDGIAAAEDQGTSEYKSEMLYHFFIIAHSNHATRRG